MADNRIPLMSEQSTSAGTKRKDSNGYSWGNYSGTKDSHDVQVDQMNSKDYNGEYGAHKYYSPKTGHQGVKGENSPRKKG